LYSLNDAVNIVELFLPSHATLFGVTILANSFRVLLSESMASDTSFYKGDKRGSSTVVGTCADDDWRMVEVEGSVGVLVGANSAAAMEGGRLLSLLPAVRSMYFPSDAACSIL
jgi:hypothetical protein